MQQHEIVKIINSLKVALLSTPVGWQMDQWECWWNVEAAKPMEHKEITSDEYMKAQRQ